MKLYYIYKITNNANGKTYIGQHKYDGDKYTDGYESLINDGYLGSGVSIAAARKKYGKDNFNKEILVSHLECKEAADEAERYFIKYYRELGKAEYNIADGGEGATGVVPSEDTRKKLSESHKGLKNNLGNIWSEESRVKASESHKGKRPSDNCIKKAQERFNELWKSEEFKEKMTGLLKANQYALGNKHTDEWKQQNSERMKGHTFNKGRHWFNNGEKQVFQFECPNGFVPGRLLTVKNKNAG